MKDDKAGRKRNMKEIKLADYVDDSRMLSGKDLGQEVRRKLDIETLEKEQDHILIQIPDDVFLVSSSFFKGLFGDSIRTLGRSGFRAKYDFTGPISRLTIADAIADVELLKSMGA